MFSSLRFAQTLRSIALALSAATLQSTIAFRDDCVMAGMVIAAMWLVSVYVLCLATPDWRRRVVSQQCAGCADLSLCSSDEIFQAVIPLWRCTCQQHGRKWVSYKRKRQQRRATDKKNLMSEIFPSPLRSIARKVSSVAFSEYSRSALTCARKAIVSGLLSPVPDVFMRLSASTIRFAYHTPAREVCLLSMARAYTV